MDIIDVLERLHRLKTQYRNWVITMEIDEVYLFLSTSGFVNITEIIDPKDKFKYNIKMTATGAEFLQRNPFQKVIVEEV